MSKGLMHSSRKETEKVFPSFRIETEKVFTSFRKETEIFFPSFRKETEKHPPVQVGSANDRVRLTQYAPARP